MKIDEALFDQPSPGEIVAFQDPDCSEARMWKEPGEQEGLVSKVSELWGQRNANPLDDIRKWIDKMGLPDPEPNPPMNTYPSGGIPGPGIIPSSFVPPLPLYTMSGNTSTAAIEESNRTFTTMMESKVGDIDQFFVSARGGGKQQFLHELRLDGNS